jgi:hypothetical protein
VHRPLHLVSPAQRLKRSSYIQQQEAWRNDDINLDSPHLPIASVSFPREYRKRNPLSSDRRF